MCLVILANIHDSGSLLLLVSDHLARGVSLDSLGRGSVLAFLDAPDLDDPGVDGAGNAVLHLDVELGNDVSLEGSVLLQVLLRRGVHNVPDRETLHRLVLRTQATAVDANYRLDIPAVILVATVISALDWHVVN